MTQDGWSAEDGGCRWRGRSNALLAVLLAAFVAVLMVAGPAGAIEVGAAQDRAPEYLNYWVLLGVAVIVVGFLLKIDPIAVELRGLVKQAVESAAAAGVDARHNDEGKQRTNRACGGCRAAR